MNWKDGLRLLILPFAAVGLVVGFVCAPFVVGFTTGVRIVRDYMDEL